MAVRRPIATGVGAGLALAGIGLATFEPLSGLYRRFVKGKS
jgi:hypothetical protein